MLEKLFQGFIEWIYGMILEFWAYFSSALLDVLSVDFAYLQARIPILPVIQQAMLAVGWALLLGNLVFQATRGMLSGLGFEGEDPKLLFIRTFVFSFLLLASPQICSLCLNMTSTIIGIMDLPNVVDISLADATAFDGLPCAWLVAIICGVVVMFQSFKLFFALMERYFILAVLTLCAPLAFGVGGSKSTSDIFTGWCRMYGSMCLLMILHVVFVKMILSVLASAPGGVEVLLWVALVLSIVRVARKADDIITRMGLNPAITNHQGKGLGGILVYTVARHAITHAAGVIGQAAAHGARRGNPGGAAGGPRQGGPAGGAGFRSPSARQTNPQTAHGQKTRDAARQEYTAQAGATQNHTKEHTAEYGSTCQGKGPVRQTSVFSGSTQRSSAQWRSGQTTTGQSAYPGMAGKDAPISSGASAQRRTAAPGRAGTSTPGSGGNAARIGTHTAHERHTQTATLSREKVGPSAAGSMPSAKETAKEDRSTPTRSTKQPSDLAQSKTVSRASFASLERKETVSPPGTAGTGSAGTTRQSARRTESPQTRPAQGAPSHTSVQTQQAGQPVSRKVEADNRPGTAEKGPSPSVSHSSKAPRPGRNTTPPVTLAAVQPRQPSPARQEQEPSPRHQPGIETRKAAGTGRAETATKGPVGIAKPQAAQSAEQGMSSQKKLISRKATAPMKKGRSSKVPKSHRGGEKDV